MLALASSSLKRTRIAMHDFSTNSLETGPVTSATITLSHVVVYMSCGVAMVCARRDLVGPQIGVLQGPLSILLLFVAELSKYRNRKTFIGFSS